MKYPMKNFVFNFSIVVFVFAITAGISEFVYIKFFAPKELNIKQTWECGFFRSSLISGYKPNCKGKWTKTSQTETFDTDFSTDEFGRRIVFNKKKPANTDSGQVLFFGGSDILGQGIDDKDTLTNQFFNLSDFVSVRNYGSNGSGPQHLLELFQFSDITKESPVDPDRNIMLFFFSDNHVERAVGSWSIATTWGSQFPYYVLNQEDQLFYKGNFETGGRYHPVLLLAKKSLLLDNFISNVSSRLSYSDSNIRLTAKIFAEVKVQFEKKYKNSKFYIVMNPVTYRSGEKLKVYLKEFGVDYLDYAKVWDPQDIKNRIPNGEHPGVEVYRLIAERLANDLKK